MKAFWNHIQLIFAAIGGWLGWFIGGWNGLFFALVLFAAVDYITGVMCAISDKKLSSAVGFKGICRKVLIFILVGVGNALDLYVLGKPGVLRTAVIFFYLSNEGLSLLENSVHLGLPVPDDLKKVLEQLHKGEVQAGHEAETSGAGNPAGDEPEKAVPERINENDMDERQIRIYDLKRTAHEKRQEDADKKADK